MFSLNPVLKVTILLCALKAKEVKPIQASGIGRVLYLWMDVNQICKIVNGRWTHYKNAEFTKSHWFISIFTTFQNCYLQKMRWYQFKRMCSEIQYFCMTVKRLRISRLLKQTYQTNVNARLKSCLTFKS